MMRPTHDAAWPGWAEPGGAEEAKAAFHLALRARGVRDLAVLRAMERVERAPFLDPIHAGLAARDLPVPIAGGETASPAWLTARMIEAAGVEPGHRVLQVGAGSGYATAILRQIGAAVTAVERVRSLAGSAGARLAALGLPDEVVWGDGLDLPGGEGGGYDRILVHASCADRPLALLARLAEGGALVCARPAAGGQEARRIEAEREAGDTGDAGEARWREVAVCPCRLAPLRRGLSDL